MNETVKILLIISGVAGLIIAIYFIGKKISDKNKQVFNQKPLNEGEGENGGNGNNVDVWQDFEDLDATNEAGRNYLKLKSLANLIIDYKKYYLDQYGVAKQFLIKTELPKVMSNYMVGFNKYFNENATNYQYLDNSLETRLLINDFGNSNIKTNEFSIYPYMEDVKDYITKKYGIQIYF